MLKRILFLTAAILFTLVLIVHFPRRFIPMGIKPDILLILVIFFNIYRSRRQGAGIALGAGFLKDVLSFAQFGTFLISFTVSAYVTRRLKKFLYREEFLQQAFFVFVVTILNVLTICLLNVFSAKPHVMLLIVLRGLPESIFTALLSPVVFLVVKRCVPKYSY